MSKFTVLTASAMLGLMSTSAFAATEIEWWHAMGGATGESLEKITNDFNASQDEYVIKPVNKGDYTETLTAAISAFRAGEQPAMVQVFEVGTATMMSAKGAIYPVEQLMSDMGQPFDKSDYLPAVISYYQTSDGELLSMPFNSSTPVLWYNKDALDAAGVEVPTTWDEMKTAANALVENGMKCGFSFGWQSWVMLENYDAWHNLPFASKENGFAGLDTELEFNNEHSAKLLDEIAAMQDSGAFTYGGRKGDSLGLFTNGECGMWMNSSAYYGSIKEQAKFEFGQSMLPLDTTVADKPQNSIIGGATIWVLQGKDEEQYKGVAEFMTFLSKPDIQARWAEETGYVPITNAAYDQMKSEGFFDENPGTDTAIKQLTLNTPTPNSRGIRLGNFTQIRDANNEELEALWTGDKTAQEALDAAVERGNKLLRDFEDTNK